MSIRSGASHFCFNDERFSDSAVRAHDSGAGGGALLVGGARVLQYVLADAALQADVLVSVEERIVECGRFSADGRDHCHPRRHHARRPELTHQRHRTVRDPGRHEHADDEQRQTRDLQFLLNEALLLSRPLFNGAAFGREIGAERRAYGRFAECGVAIVASDVHGDAEVAVDDDEHRHA